MGLLSIIRKLKRREREMRLLLVGLDNAGKTTVVKRLVGEDTSSISPTLGFSITTMHLPARPPEPGSLRSYQLNIWDVGGQKTLRPYWRNYFENTEGLIWVVDSSDRRRLQDCRAELQGLLQEERLAGASLLILANKQDVAGAASPSEISQLLQLEALGSYRHWHIEACSAVTGTGLLPGFDWLISDIGSRIYMFD
eukprot:SM000688S20533  [mRNA]  locus=s688:101:1086:+ [translate_table: standard]